MSSEAGVMMSHQLTEQWELHRNRISFIDLTSILPFSRTNSIKRSFSSVFLSGLVISLNPHKKTLVSTLFTSKGKLWEALLSGAAVLYLSPFVTTRLSFAPLPPILC